MRFTTSFLMIGTLLTIGAFAEDPDGIMGVYQGKFTTESWANRTIEAKVVALSKSSWKIVLYIGDGREVQRVQGKGKRADDQSPVEIEGRMDLGQALGGTYSLEARIADGKLSGSLLQRRQEVAAFALAYSVIQPPSLGTPAPEGAKVLFDGTNLDQWVRNPEKWCLSDEGAMQVCGSDLMTREEFGAVQIHLEFRTPFMPNAREQGRGNSGVYVAGRYEVQVLDSFGEEAKWDYCGGIYKVAAPLANACLPPLQWQTYDITFQPAVFDASGTKTKNARITVLLNGIPIHDDLELPERTPGGLGGVEAATGPLYLQDHGNEVRYRNIWVRPL